MRARTVSHPNISSIFATKVFWINLETINSCFSVSRECMLRGRSFYPDDNTKPALVDWRPFIFVTILVIGMYMYIWIWGWKDLHFKNTNYSIPVLVVTCVIINVWRRRRTAKNTLKIDEGDEVEEEEEDHRSQYELDVWLPLASMKWWVGVSLIWYWVISENLLPFHE